MTRISPIDPAALPDDMRAALDDAVALMGFTPNDVLTMARWPAFLSAVKGVVDVIYAPGALDGELKRLMATVVSGAAGCQYCEAHAAHGAVTLAGVSAEKLAQVWEFESSALYSDAERCALRLALAAGQQPNSTTDAHFSELRQFFSEQQIVEMLGLLSLFGLLNRWNATLATAIEDAPRDVAARCLADR
ncbi:MAG: carboxymuconolactone decarboxylase family protein [Pseudomonadota bacterium]